MDERKNNNHPWDDSVYGTGRTEPPKSHGGTVALLLILIIFLCGIITVLGVLNVRLFQKLNTRRESEQSISFATGAALPAAVFAPGLGAAFSAAALALVRRKKGQKK